MGRVWSKVVSFVTPESLWEVRTSNAVAVVRGTAFGVEYTSSTQKRVTRIIGNERTVAVGVLDPITKGVIKMDVGIIKPNTYTEINDEIIEKIKEDVVRASQLVVIREIPAEVRNQTWIKKSIDQDRNVDQKLKEFNGDVDRLKDFIEHNSIQNRGVDPLPPPKKIHTTSTTSGTVPSLPIVVEKKETIVEDEEVVSFEEPTLYTPEERNKKRRTDINKIWNAIQQNITDGGGVFGGAGAKSCNGIDFPTEMSNIAESDIGGLQNFDLSCLIPKYLGQMPLDPDGITTGHYWNSAEDYFTGYQIFFDETENEVVVVSIRAERGEKIYKGGSGFFPLPGEDSFAPALFP